MEVINEIYPSDPLQLQEMLKPGPPGPIYLVNLLKFKDTAEYEDGRETELTGREAYSIYTMLAKPIVEEYGGRIVLEADPSFLMLGQVEKMWDKVAIASYPSRPTIIKMMSSEQIQDIAVHRRAGLQGQLNFETIWAEDTPPKSWLDRNS